MNTKPEQIQTGSSVAAAETQNPIAPDARAAELTDVTNEELDQVEGGSAVSAKVLQAELASARDSMMFMGRNGSGSPYT